MKKRIGFIGIILLIVIGFDLLVGAASGKLIKEVPDVGVNQTNTAQALFSREADVLILGSSRANHSFDCRVLEDSLGMSCYNAGRDGQNMAYDAMVFFTYIERHVPKLVILDIASSMMDDSWFESLKEMNCYYGLADPLDRIIDENAKWIDKLKLKSGLYRYNNTWQWLLHAYRAKSEADKDGYRPMPVNVKNPFKVSFVNEKVFHADNRCVNYLDKIRMACVEKGITLVITYTPSLVVVKNGGVDKWVADYCKRTGMLFKDYGRMKMFYEHPELFYDMTHLNKQGAKIFSEVVAKDLKNIIK